MNETTNKYVANERNKQTKCHVNLPSSDGLFLLLGSVIGVQIVLRKVVLIAVPLIITIATLIVLLTSHRRWCYQ
jgi:hypothetical protein